MRAKCFCIFYFCGLNYVYVPKKSKKKKKLKKIYLDASRIALKIQKIQFLGGKNWKK